MGWYRIDQDGYIESENQFSRLNGLSSASMGGPSGAAAYGLSGQLKVTTWDPRRLEPLTKIVQVPEGEAGTAATVGLMADLATQAATDPQFILIAQEIVRNAGVGAKDFRGELKAVYDWMVRNTKYRQDPRSLEWIQSPYYSMMVRGELDCDDYATTLLALAMALGHGGGFVTYKADPARPDEFSHVTCMLGYRSPEGPQWVHCDPTYLGTDGGFGWTPPETKYFSRKYWSIAPP